MYLAKIIVEVYPVLLQDLAAILKWSDGDIFWTA